jgi:hypothetical protein
VIGGKTVAESSIKKMKTVSDAAKPDKTMCHFLK